MKRMTAALVFAGLLAGSAAAGIYKWTDERGVTHYTASPPTGGAAEELSLPAGPPRERLDKAQEEWRSELEKKRRSEVPQTVHGTVVIGLVATGVAVLPRRVRKVTLLIRLLEHGKQIRRTIRDPHPDWVLDAQRGARVACSHHNFELQLPPGSYRIHGIEFEAEGIWSKPIGLPSGGVDFQVPEGSCTYIGRIGWVVLILSPASPSQAEDMVQGLIKKSAVSPGVVYYYHPRGSLVPMVVTVDQPSPEDGRHDMIAPEKASASQCLTSIATHAQ